MKSVLLMSICLCSLAAAAQASKPEKNKPDWMQVVTAAGQPCVEIKLADSGRAGLFEKVTLMHRLCFDGVRYLSRISITELESRLVPKEPGIYEWLTPDGRSIELNTKDARKSPAAVWRIVPISAAGDVAVVGSEQEVFVYQKSKFVEYEKAGKRYTIKSKGGVWEVTDSRGKILIRQAEGDVGVKTVTAFGSTATLKYNADGECLSCTGDLIGTVEFQYSSGLLVGICKAKVGSRFEWGAARNATYDNPAWCIAPVVIRSAPYSFTYVTNTRVLMGEVLVDGEKLGSWSYGFKGGQHSYKAWDKR